MSQLIMMRHGESVWNKKNQFTGWVDISLSPKGVQEAMEGGLLIKDISIDVMFVSSLIRSQMTAMLAMLQHSSGKVPRIVHPKKSQLEEWGQVYNENAEDGCIPTYEAWELNERYYGELQGLNKDETREKYGKEQVHIWRRSYSTTPPNGESLEMTAERTLPYFKENILPFLKDGKNVFISAHGNSIRAITMNLENLSQDEVVGLEIPTGKPIIYDFTDGKFLKK